MAKEIIYDKAKYHNGASNFPKDLSYRQGYVHTGMFVGWILDNDLYNRTQIPVDFSAILAFKERKITGAEFYEKFLDGVLTDKELSGEGNAFAQHYFDFDTGCYLQDYSEILARNLPSLYHVTDTWENYQKIKQRIDKRYNEWRSNHQNDT